jgi:signal transduction histidine kinase
MQMFADNKEVARLESAIAPLADDARLTMLAPLAWHLRERDTPRALALAEQGMALLMASELTTAERDNLHARLQLIIGAAKLLFAETDVAEQHINSALHTFHLQNDAIGSADAHWLLAAVAHDRGQGNGRDSQLDAMAADARRAGDTLRHDIAQAEIARAAMFRDPQNTQARWRDSISSDTSDLPPAVAACINDYLSVAASQQNDFGRSTAYGILAYESALASGQIRRAIKAATNIGDDFNALNDHHAALEWMQRGLDLARPTGWPGSIGGCLMQTASTLRSLGRLEAAQELLRRALSTLGPLPGSRNYAIVLLYMGELALDRGDYPLALTTFNQLLKRANALGLDDVKSVACCGQAHALSKLDYHQEALTAATCALALAQQKNDSPKQIAALRVLAEIHTRHSLPWPSDMTAINPPLHYLQQTLAIANGIDGYTIPGELLDAIGREYANVGAYDQAYHIGLQANQARAKIHSQEAGNRAIAMQVQHQTERAYSDGEHHRQLAASEAKRAEVLQRTNSTLERLSAIGQEITAHLNASAVFETLNRHVHGLLDVSYFGVYLMEPSGLALNRAFGIEGDRPLPAGRVLLSDRIAISARCVRERREILIHSDPLDETVRYIPDTLKTMSLIFAPLMIAERVLGVMTIQSVKVHAYEEREQLIFRSLCAYGAIAIDNASTYQALQQAQAQLVAQEQLVAQQKLAALGALVAGVAHELNTPLGNSLMMASAMQDDIDEMNQKMREQSIQRSDLLDYLDDAQEATTLIIRGLTNATTLVNSFKQISVDRATAQRRMFNLRQVAEEIVESMIRKIEPLGHGIVIDIPADIMMNSYPSSLGQVLASLINNCLLHAFDGRSNGHMHLSACQQEVGRVQIKLKDDGVGIPAQNLPRIFDPFFTTKMGQGGNGLGLNISYNIVTSLLNGQISVASVADGGATFMLDLPLTAAEQPS